MKRVFKPFVQHHATMKWQAWDWKYLKENFPKGTWSCVQDFSENLKIEVKMEVRGLPMCFPVSSSSPSYFRASPALYLLQHQSKYYCAVSVTLFGAVGTFHVDDVRESYLGAEQRNMLKDKGATHIICAARKQDAVGTCYEAHDGYCKPPACSFIRSDGAPTQFANATQFYWIGRQHCPQ